MVLAKEGVQIQFWMDFEWIWTPRLLQNHSQKSFEPSQNHSPEPTQYSAFRMMHSPLPITLFPGPAGWAEPLNPPRCLQLCGVLDNPSFCNGMTLVIPLRWGSFGRTFDFAAMRSVSWPECAFYWVPGVQQADCRASPEARMCVLLSPQCPAGRLPSLPRGTALPCLALPCLALPACLHACLPACFPASAWLQLPAEARERPANCQK